MSIFDSSTLGTATNQVVFNDYTSFPIYRVQHRQPQQRQIRDLDINLPFESGITDFLTLTGKVAYVIEGTMYPGSEADYDTGLRALRKVASLDVEQADTDSDTGYVPYSWTEHDGIEKQLFLKVLYVDAPQSTRQGLVQPFRLVCKIKDPTIFSTPSSTASTQGVDPTLGGGTSLYPFGYPVLYGGNTFSVTNVATNTGDIPVYPLSITVVGPVANPVITNGATGELIKVNTSLASSSNVLTIIYDKDTLSVEVDGSSVLANVDSSTTYFKLQPGANQITLSGDTVGSGAYVAVNYYSGWPLS